jgi:hypothetical protein
VLGQDVDSSSPTIANGVAYIGTIDGKLAVNAEGRDRSLHSPSGSASAVGRSSTARRS